MMDTDKAKNNMLGLFMGKPNASEPASGIKSGGDGQPERKMPADTMIPAPSRGAVMSDEEVFSLNKRFEAERDVFRNAMNDNGIREQLEMKKELEIQMESDEGSMKANEDIAGSGDYDVFEDEKTNIWVKMSDADKIYCKRRAKMLYRRKAIGSTTYTDLFAWLIRRDRAELKKSESRTRETEK